MANKTRPHFNSDAQAISNIESMTSYEQYINAYERSKLKEELRLTYPKISNAGVDNWISKNEDEFNNRIKSHGDAVALARFNDMKNVITSAEYSTFLLNSDKNKYPAHASPAKMQETYNKLSIEFYDYVRNVANNGLQKNQSGTALIRNTIDINGFMRQQYTQRGVSIPSEQLLAANRNIIDKGEFVAYDIETLGGVDHTGQQQLDAITEYSFGVADSKTGVVSKHYGSIIGSTKQQHDEYNRIINKFELGEELTNRDTVILDRLAKIGNPVTAYQPIAGSPGLFEYTSFASDLDIKGMNTSHMRKGADDLLAINNMQHQEMVRRGSSELAWKRNFASGISAIVDGDLTAVGHNSGYFDHPMINRFLQSNGMAPLDLTNRHFDTLAAMRLGLGGDSMSLYSDEEKINILKAHGLTSNQLEALTRKTDPNYYDGKVAHVGKTDVGANASFYAKSGLFNQDSPNNILGNIESGVSHQLVGNQQQLFYSYGGMLQNQESAMSYVEDSFTGNARTFSGMSIGAQGAERELFGQHGFQKGVSYTLDNIYEHSMTDEWGNTIKDIHPSLAQNQIVTAKFSPVVFGDIDSFKSTSPVVLVGTREQVSRHMNQSLLMTGKKDANGNWQALTPDEMGNDVSKLMDKFNYDPITETESVVPFSIQDQLEESNLAIQNESAARARRSVEIKKEKGLLDFFNDMDEYVNAKSGENASEDVRNSLRKEFHDTIRKQSIALASKAKTGETLNTAGADMLGTYQQYFGFYTKGSADMSVYRETVDAAIGSKEYSNSIRGVMSKIDAAARKRGGEDKALQDFYFKQYYNAVYSHAAKNVPGGIDAVTNTQPISVRNIDRNKFDVDLSRYVPKDKVSEASLYADNSHILTIDLNSSNMSLPERLMRKRGAVGATDDIEKKKEIKSFIKHLSDTGIIPEQEIDITNETVETLSKKATGLLADVRKGDKTGRAGRLINPKRQNVTMASGLAAHEYTDEVIDKIIAEADKTIPAGKHMNKTNLRTEAQNIIKDVLFDHVTTEDLMKSGIAREHAEDLMSMRSIRMKDTENFVYDFLNNISENTSGSILYDKESKNIHLLSKVNGEHVYTKLDNLPRDIYEDGRLYTKIGNMKVEAAVGYHSSEYGNNPKFRSLIGKAHDDVYWMGTALKRGEKDGNVADQVQRVLSSFARPLRESPSVFAGDAQDVRAQHAFAFKDLIPKLQDYYKQGMFDGMTFEHHDDFINMLKKSKKLDVNRLSLGENNLITLNFRNILHAKSKNSGNATERILASKATLANKNISDFTGTTYARLHFGDNYGTSKRGHYHQVSRALMYDASSVKAKIAQKALKDITIGKSLHTSNELIEATKRLKGLSYDTSNSVGIKRLSITTKDIHSLIDSHSFSNPYIAEMLSTVHLEEGAAVADPEMLDNIFNTRPSMQKIAMHKVSEHNIDVIKDLNAKRSMAPKMFIDKDGKVAFEYANGVFVNQGEDLLNINGFKGTSAAVRAKEKGMFRFGAFSKTNGLLADATSVMNTLNTPENMNRIANAVDAKQEAYRILNSQYDLNYYVHAYDANTHRKMAEGGIEKNMTHFMAGGLGTGEDGRTAKTLKALGLEANRYEVPNSEYLESLASKDISNTAFGALINKNRERALGHQEITDIISANHGSTKEFYDALRTERSAPWRALHGEVLEKSGLLEAGEAVHFISNNMAAEKKHQDPSGSINRVADELMDRNGGDVNKVHKILTENGAMPGLTIQNGALVAPSDMRINVDALQKVIDDNKLSTVRVTTDKKIKADVSRTHLNAMNFWDRESSGLKITDRNLQVLDWQHYDVNNLAKVRAALGDDKFKSAFGHAVDLQDGAINIKEAYKGKSIALGVSDNIRRAMLSQPGEKMLLKNGERVNEAELRKFASNGVDLTPTLRALENKGIKNASIDAVEDRYAVTSSALARAWNAGNINSYDEMVSHGGFTPMTMNELITSTGHNDEIGEKLYGKKIMLDLHMPELGNNQLYENKAERYVALPYSPERWIDPGHNQEAKTTFQQKASVLKRQALDYSSGVNSIEGKKKIVEKMKDTIVDIKREVSHSVNAKGQGLASLGAVKLNDSARFKGSGIQLFGDEKSTYLRGIEFDGKNLVESAAKNIEYDASFVGRDFLMNKVYNKAYLDNLGISPEEMVEHLKTKGTLAVTVREPSENVKSTSAAGLYLSDTITGNRAISTSAQALSRDADYDGDDLGINVMKGEAHITRNGKTVLQDIDKASYDILKSKGIDVELTEETRKAFEDATASVHHNAIVENSRYTNLGKVEDVIEKNSMNLKVLRNFAINGELRPQVSAYLTTDEAMPKMKMFEDIHNKMISIHGADAVADMKPNGHDYRENAIKAINSMHQDQTQREIATDALHYGLSIQSAYADNVIKQGKAGAGIANHHLNHLRRLVDHISSFENISQDERDAIHQVGKAVQEVFLSPKNQSDIDVHSMDKFTSAYKKMLGYDGATDGTDMKNLLMDRVKGSKEIKEDGLSFAQKIESFSNIGARFVSGEHERAFFNQGLLKNDININDALITTGKDIDSIDREVSVIQETINQMGYSKNNNPVVETKLIATKAISNKAPYVPRQPSSAHEAEEGIGDLLRGVRRKMADSNVTGKGLAFGALGLAGATMLAGFVGGNPSKPAETHAQDESEDEYKIPQLTDTNLNKSRGGPQQGYVININAQTSQGQQHASSAIQQALSSGFNNTNINVAMNIHNSGQTNARQVSQMLEAAFQ